MASNDVISAIRLCCILFRIPASAESNFLVLVSARTNADSVHRPGGVIAHRRSLRPNGLQPFHLADVVRPRVHLAVLEGVVRAQRGVVAG